MIAVLGAPRKTGVCQNPVVHHPGYERTVWHHLIPKMWGGADIPLNLLELCDNCHYAVHVLIDLAVRNGYWSASASRKFSHAVRRWARFAWDGRPAHPRLTSLVFGE